jgi:hypothetical protein
MAKRGKQIRIFLIDGTPNSPRTIQIGQWSGFAFYSKEASLRDKLNDREEFDKAGVYLMKSQPEDDVYAERVYIGEAEKIRDRLKAHIQSGKEFEEIVFFAAADEQLTKAHVKYLESRLVELAKEAKTAEIENSTTPGRANLPESDCEDMETFIDNIKLILPVVGYQCLVPSQIKDAPKPTAEDVVYDFVKKRLTAAMVVQEGKYVVKKGSEARIQETDSCHESIRKARARLLREGVLQEQNGVYVFMEDYAFGSSSGAAGVLGGLGLAGPINWRNRKTGKLLKEDLGL